MFKGVPDLKYIRNALFLVFITALTMARPWFNYYHHASLNGFYDHITYFGAFGCFMICAGFRKSPLSVAALVCTAAAAAVWDSSFAFLFFPVYINLFFIIKSFEKQEAKEQLTSSAVYTGMLLSAVACAAYRLYGFTGNPGYTLNDSTCRIAFPFIISAFVGLTALFISLISHLSKKGTINTESVSAFRMFILSYLCAPDIKDTYKKKSSNKKTVLPFLKFAYIMNALLIAFGFYYFSKSLYFGLKGCIFALHWLIACAAIILRGLNIDFPHIIKDRYKRLTQ